jgi:hypothetical protein
MSGIHLSLVTSHAPLAAAGIEDEVEGDDDGVDMAAGRDIEGSGRHHNFLKLTLFHIRKCIQFYKV